MSICILLSNKYLHILWNCEELILWFERFRLHINRNFLPNIVRVFENDNKCKMLVVAIFFSFLNSRHVSFFSSLLYKETSISIQTTRLSLFYKAAVSSLANLLEFNWKSLWGLTTGSITSFHLVMAIGPKLLYFSPLSQNILKW